MLKNAIRRAGDTRAGCIALLLGLPLPFVILAFPFFPSPFNFSETTMNDSLTPPRVEGFTSLGTRVSWSAIFTGTLLALGVYFLLATLGGAVGLSISNHTTASTLRTGMIVWAFLIAITALFVGGLATAHYTIGENKVEAVIEGVITWALVFSLLLALGAMGLRAGITAMTGLANSAQAGSTQNWEASARAAGVSQQQLDEWRRTPVPTAGPSSQEQEAALEAAKRIGWYAFAGTWLSMLAAAGGAYLGAGRRFHVVAA